MASTSGVAEAATRSFPRSIPRPLYIGLLCMVNCAAIRSGVHAEHRSGDYLRSGLESASSARTRMIGSTAAAAVPQLSLFSVRFGPKWSNRTRGQYRSDQARVAPARREWTADLRFESYLRSQPPQQ